MPGPVRQPVPCPYGAACGDVLTPLMTATRVHVDWAGVTNPSVSLLRANGMAEPLR